MNNQLSVTSRILVAFASGALIAVYFLPAWRIDLFAPQYPEGLTMYIWINKLSGDVDIINGLNHYIGMKHINASMFPEFHYLPFVVGFFMLLGMMASITGKRKILFIYLTLTVIGAMLVMYDFYSWGYDYGHNLDPKAAIQVPGLSYQPPLFGHKRLLNFDAYSYPDVAGWIVVGAAVLAGFVWFFEWYRHRKKKPDSKYSTVISFLSVAFILSSCSTRPEPFTIGQDHCYSCKMGIVDLKFGGEIITRKGKIYKFDDMGCMISFLNSGGLEEKDIKSKLVMNYEKPNEFIDVSIAWFLTSQAINSPMNSHIAGFTSKENATKITGERNNNNIANWPEIFNRNK